MFRNLLVTKELPYPTNLVFSGSKMKIAIKFFSFLVFRRMSPPLVQDFDRMSSSCTKVNLCVQQSRKLDLFIECLLNQPLV